LVAISRIVGVGIVRDERVMSLKRRLMNFKEIFLGARVWALWIEIGRMGVMAGVDEARRGMAMNILFDIYI